MATHLVLRDDENGLARLTFNRPDQLNALSLAVFQELEGHLDAIDAATDDVGCVVIRGSGRCFSAGNDMADIKAGVEPPYPGYQGDVIDKIAALPQPVIMAVHGHCLTGALELALAGDLIVAAESASFADTHGKWGMSAIWGMTQRLPRRLGRPRAVDLMLTGRRVGGTEAAAIGLADRVFPDDEFDMGVDALTRAILDNSWFTARVVKQLAAQTESLPLTEGLAVERHRDVLVSPDFEHRMSGWK